MTTMWTEHSGCSIEGWAKEAERGECEKVLDVTNKSTDLSIWKLKCYVPSGLTWWNSSRRMTLNILVKRFNIATRPCRSTIVLLKSTGVGIINLMKVTKCWQVPKGLFIHHLDTAPLFFQQAILRSLNRASNLSPQMQTQKFNGRQTWIQS